MAKNNNANTTVLDFDVKEPESKSTMKDFQKKLDLQVSSLQAEQTTDLGKEFSALKDLNTKEGTLSLSSETLNGPLPKVALPSTSDFMAKFGPALATLQLKDKDLAAVEKSLSDALDALLAELKKPDSAVPPSGYEEAIKNSVSATIQSLSQINDTQKEQLTVQLNDIITNMFPKVGTQTFLSNLDANLNSAISTAISKGQQSIPGEDGKAATPGPLASIDSKTGTALSKAINDAIEKVLADLWEQGTQGALLDMADGEERANYLSNFITNLFTYVKTFETSIAKAAKDSVTASKEITTTDVNVEEFGIKFNMLSDPKDGALQRAGAEGQGGATLNLIKGRINSIAPLVDILITGEQKDNKKVPSIIDTAELNSVKLAGDLARLQASNATLTTDVTQATTAIQKVTSNTAADFADAVKALTDSMTKYSAALKDYQASSNQYELDKQLGKASGAAIQSINSIRSSVSPPKPVSKSGK